MKIVSWQLYHVVRDTVQKGESFQRVFSAVSGFGLGIFYS